MSTQPGEQFKLRLPEGMREELKKSADENERTLNAEIVFRLKISLRSEPAALETSISHETKEALDAIDFNIRAAHQRMHSTYLD